MGVLGRDCFPGTPRPSLHSPSTDPVCWPQGSPIWVQPNCPCNTAGCSWNSPVRAIEDGGLTPEQARGLERALPAYDRWCAELAASPIPDSLQHDDLHSNNVCWPGDVDDLSSVRIIDWGDASVGHPFGTMLATLNSIAFHAGALHVDRDMDPRVLRVRDAYLEPFTLLSRRDELLRWVELARSTGCVTRALAWERALQEAPQSVITEHEFPVRGWLLELLEPWADVG